MPGSGNSAPPHRILGFRPQGPASAFLKPSAERSSVIRSRGLQKRHSCRRVGKRNPPPGDSPLTAAPPLSYAEEGLEFPADWAVMTPPKSGEAFVIIGRLKLRPKDLPSVRPIMARRPHMSDQKKLMALRDASVDARRKAALGLDMGDPSSLETLTRTHILIMALDAVLDELPPDADVAALVG
jgi:hypothetical protein